MADQEQLAYYQGMLSPFYNLEDGEPLDGLDPFPREIALYMAMKNAQQDGEDLQPGV